MAKKLFEVLSPREKELRANLKTLKLDHSLDSETLSRRSTPDEVKAELRSKMSFRQTKINNIENEIERLNPSIKPGNVIDLNDTRFKNNGKFEAVSNIRHSGVFHLIHDTDTGKKHLVNPQSGEVIYHNISSEMPVHDAKMLGFKKINEGFLNEKLDPKADMKEWIRDFLKSDAPQFKGKTKKEKIKMAIAAYYDAKRSSKKKNVKEEVEFVNEGEQHSGVDYQQESYHWANEEDHEGEMILSQLMSISEKTAQLCKSIDEDDQFEGWIQAKITKAEDYINSVYNYLMYRKNDDKGYDERMHDVMKSSMPMIKMNIMKLRKESRE